MLRVFTFFYNHKVAGHNPRIDHGISGYFHKKTGLFFLNQKFIKGN